ncbi:hypothetical protein DLAC_08032 [Tieghemostelium lacteum]|uniref:Uncharacterized protein n=1 Tax=Tieghemostelium lacteum TaxID=361077 RepID=A0A151ZB16_TIELA|nr:hypothetical protein DLAC_08032 [Tieghemostelium lacteum]|eukprot:KYQ91125.1 hypothetical protein DLAC_08032 [Tieghemostelium lacteum]
MVKLTRYCLLNILEHTINNLSVGFFEYEKRIVEWLSVFSLICKEWNNDILPRLTIKDIDVDLPLGRNLTKRLLKMRMNIKVVLMDGDSNTYLTSETDKEFSKSIEGHVYSIRAKISNQDDIDIYSRYFKSVSQFILLKTPLPLISNLFEGDYQFDNLTSLIMNIDLGSQGNILKHGKLQGTRNSWNLWKTLSKQCQVKDYQLTHITIDGCTPFGTFVDCDLDGFQNYKYPCLKLSLTRCIFNTPNLDEYLQQVSELYLSNVLIDPDAKLNGYNDIFRLLSQSRNLKCLRINQSGKPSDATLEGIAYLLNNTKSLRLFSFMDPKFEEALPGFSPVPIHNETLEFISGQFLKYWKSQSKIKRILYAPNESLDFDSIYNYHCSQLASFSWCLRPEANVMSGQKSVLSRIAGLLSQNSIKTLHTLNIVSLIDAQEKIVDLDLLLKSLQLNTHLRTLHITLPLEFKDFIEFIRSNHPTINTFSCLEILNFNLQEFNETLSKNTNLSNLTVKKKTTISQDACSKEELYDILQSIISHCYISILKVPLLIPVSYACTKDQIDHLKSQIQRQTNIIDIQLTNELTL